MVLTHRCRDNTIRHMRYATSASARGQLRNPLVTSGMLDVFKASLIRKTRSHIHPLRKENEHAPSFKEKMHIPHPRRPRTIPNPPRLALQQCLILAHLCPLSLSTTSSSLAPSLSLRRPSVSWRNLADWSSFRFRLALEPVSTSVSVVVRLSLPSRMGRMLVTWGALH